MDSIFYGLVLILLDVKINGVSLIPNFIGYYLVYRGLGHLANESRHFAELKPWCVGMGIYTALTFAASLFHVRWGSAATVLTLVSTVVFLYIHYRLIQGVQDLQVTHPAASLEVSLLQRRFRNFLVIVVAVHLFPLFTKNGLVIGVLTLGSMVVYILFLMTFHRSRQAYYAALRAQTAESEGHAEYSEPVIPTEPESPTE